MDDRTREIIADGIMPTAKDLFDRRLDKRKLKEVMDAEAHKYHIAMTNFKLKERAETNGINSLVEQIVMLGDLKDASLEEIKMYLGVDDPYGRDSDFVYRDWVLEIREALVKRYAEEEINAAEV